MGPDAMIFVFWMLSFKPTFSLSSSDNSVALSFINVSNENKSEVKSIDAETIVRYIGGKMPDKEAFLNAGQYKVIDLWTGNESINKSGKFEAESLDPADSLCIKVIPIWQIL